MAASGARARGLIAAAVIAAASLIVTACEPLDVDPSAQRGATVASPPPPKPEPPAVQPRRDAEGRIVVRPGAQQPAGEAPRGLMGRIGTMPGASGGCAITVSTVWAQGPRGPYVAEARSFGNVCASARLRLELRRADGEVIWGDELGAVELFGFTEVGDTTRMRGRMVDWVTSYGKVRRTARNLPARPTGAPKANEPAFELAQGLTKAEYDAIRADNRPLYCYVSSQTELSCLVLGEKGLDVTMVGRQKFR